MALRVSVGQYYSADSPIHELDPRAKVALTLVYMVSCFFVANPAMLALSGAFVFAAIAASRVPARLLLRSVRTIMFFLVFTSVFNLFFVQTGQVLLEVGPATFTCDGVWAAALYTLRFLFLLLMGALLMCTTTPIALTDAAEDLLAPLARLGVPVHDAALIMSIALRFVPTLSREAENIVAAQTARGADLENKGPLAYARACVPLVVPLFASALRHAENLGRAMDARCYVGGARRTRFHVMSFVPERDGVAVAGMLLYLAGLAALGVLL